MLTIALVVMVIFLFLRSLAATVIPSVAVPLSLVGTFAVMYLLGYSLDNLSLMALTISTGFVVDDAIVMIENIDRLSEEGDTPLEAALKGAGQIGFTIVSLTVSLIAVLIPLLFMGDIVGRLFREFAVTLASAILVSAVISLTLTPMMCALLLRHKDERQAGPLLQGVGACLRAHHRVLRQDAERGAEASDADAAGDHRDPGRDHSDVHHRAQGLLPGAGHGRDPGHFRCAAEHLVRCDGAAAAELGGRHPEGPGRRQPVVVHRGGRARTRRQNSGRIQINLKPRDERSDDAPRRSSSACTESTKSVEGITLYMQPVQDLTVEDRVSRTQYQYTSGRRDPKELAQLDAEGDRQAEDVAGVARRGHRPAEQRIAGATGHRSRYRSRLGVTTQAIDNTLYDAFGQRQISTMFTQLNQYHVVLEVDPQFRDDPDALKSDLCARAGASGVQSGDGDASAHDRPRRRAQARRAALRRRSADAGAALARSRISRPRPRRWRSITRGNFR